MDTTVCNTRKIQVAVTCTGVLEDFPPAVSLVSNLLDLGCKVSLLACGSGDCLPCSVRQNGNYEFISLGSRGGSPLDRGRMLFGVPKRLRSFLLSRKSELDVVWTTMAVDVRDIGTLLLDFNHVMQIPELTETVPAILHTNRWPYSAGTVRMARAAKRVVVPEYNRAFIQQAWWRLSETPAILPNKPAISNSVANASPDAELVFRFESETRRIVLYQGLFADDRDLWPFADAVDMLGGGYALYLMSKACNPAQQINLDKLISSHENIEYVGHFPAPDHLAYTPYARIGLLPYTPSYDGACPPLNALYCAPNKIWEYSRFGIPMVGSDIPGLAGIFAKHGCGETTRNDARAIADAIVRVDAAHDVMSENALRFYESVDTKETVHSILCEALSGPRRGDSDHSCSKISD